MAKRVPAKDLGELSVEAQKLYCQTRKELGLTDAAALSLLLSAARSLDRLRRAEADLTREGSVYSDRFGQPKLNPIARVVAVESNTLQKTLAALHTYSSNSFSIEPEDEDLSSRQ